MYQHNSKQRYAEGNNGQHEMRSGQVKSLPPGTQQSFGCGLITRRSRVQILPPPPLKARTTRFGLSALLSSNVLLESEVETVRRWAEAKTEPKFSDRSRVEVEVGPRSLTVFECTVIGDNWLRVSVARLGWSGTTKLWTLYRFDSNSKAHRYEFLEPRRRVTDLLDEIDDDPAFIFWG